MNISIVPIFPVTERKREEAAAPTRNPIDTKVKGFVLERISQARGALLPSATAPQIVIDLLPSFEPVKMEYTLREMRKSKLRKTPMIRKAPLGLHPVDPEGWFNALMQFILFIPGFAELFFFSPRSFFPFREFIDQYYHDQQENRSLSTANGRVLYDFILLKWPSLDFQEVFEFLLHTLHPQGAIHKNSRDAFLKGYSSDIFLTDSAGKKQIFTEPDRFCYDLDAFIELRPDGANVNFITYVKVEGAWYQCDNERILLLRSNALPLQRAILLHYKRLILP